MVMAPPQSAQKQMPVSMVGPPTTWGGVTLGLRDLPMANGRCGSAKGPRHNARQGARCADGRPRLPGAEQADAGSGRASMSIKDLFDVAGELTRRR